MIRELIDLEESIMNYKKQNNDELYVKVLVYSMLQKYFVVMNEEEGQKCPTIIMDKESKTWIPVYTSAKYIKGARTLNNIVAIGLPEIILMVINQKLDGIILNPFKETEIYIGKKDLYAVALSYADKSVADIVV